MRTRVLALLWLAFGVAIWCGFFDLYVSRGARMYLERQAEFKLHIAPEEPAMTEVMARARHDGVVAASLWSAAVVGFGWTTLWLRGGPRARASSRGSL